MATQPTSAANACYWKDVWKKLYGLRKTSKLCDVTLVSEEGILFMAHSIILASGSSVFYSQLVEKSTTFMQEMGSSTIKLQGVTGDVLQVTLDFIYGVTPETIADFKKLQKGADIFGIHGAKLFCMQQLMELEQLAKNNSCSTKIQTPSAQEEKRPVIIEKPPAIPAGKKEANIGKCPYFSNRGAEINYFVPLKKRFLMKVLTELKKDHIKAAPGHFPQEEAALREMSTGDEDHNVSRDSPESVSTASTAPAEKPSSIADQSKSATCPVQHPGGANAVSDLNRDVCRHTPRTQDADQYCKGPETSSFVATQINDRRDSREQSAPETRAQHDALMDIDADFVNSAKELIPHRIPDLSFGDMTVQCPHLKRLVGQVDLESDFVNGSATTNDLDVMGDTNGHSATHRALDWNRAGNSVNGKAIDCREKILARDDYESTQYRATNTDRKQQEREFSRMGQVETGCIGQAETGRFGQAETGRFLQAETGRIGQAERCPIRQAETGRIEQGMWDTFTDEFSPDNPAFAFESSVENIVSPSVRNASYDTSQEMTSQTFYIDRYDVINQPTASPLAAHPCDKIVSGVANASYPPDGAVIPYRKTGDASMKGLHCNKPNTEGLRELPTINTPVFHNMATLKQSADFMEGHTFRKDLSPSYSGSASSTALSPNNRTPSLSPNSMSSCSSAGPFDRNQDHHTAFVAQPAPQNAPFSMQYSAVVPNNPQAACYAVANQNCFETEENWLGSSQQFRMRQATRVSQANHYQHFNTCSVKAAIPDPRQRAFVSAVPHTPNATVNACLNNACFEQNSQASNSASVEACIEAGSGRRATQLNDIGESGPNGPFNKMMSLKTEPAFDGCTNQNENDVTAIDEKRSAGEERHSLKHADSPGSTDAADRTKDDGSDGDEKKNLDGAENTELLKMLHEGADNKVYKCLEGDCVYSNKMIEYVQSHMFHRHGYGKPDVSCPHCDKAYFSESQLRTHVKQCHEKQASVKAGSRVYSCEDCGEVFKTMQSLHTHQLKTHGKGRLFSCSDCDFKSPRKKDMQGHMISQHDKAPPGVRVFECSHCAYKCIDKNRFTEHEASHSSEKNYKCSKCEKSYSTKRGLRNHVKYHSTERPHVCSVCGATFKVRAKLRDHVKLMHLNKGQKPYKCGHCTFRASVRGNVNQHIRNTHKGLAVVVVDTQEKQRKHVKEYDYAKLSGDGIEEVMDASASGYANKAK